MDNGVYTVDLTLPQHFLDSQAGLSGPVVATSSGTRVGNSLRWRIQFSTDWGRRCVDMTSSLHPTATRNFALREIRSGGRCQLLDYDAATGETHAYWSDFNSEEKRAYRRGFLKCKSFRVGMQATRANNAIQAYLDRLAFPHTDEELAEREGCLAESESTSLPGSGLSP